MCQCEEHWYWILWTWNIYCKKIYKASVYRNIATVTISTCAVTDFCNFLKAVIIEVNAFFIAYIYLLLTMADNRVCVCVRVCRVGRLCISRVHWYTFDHLPHSDLCKKTHNITNVSYLLLYRSSNSVKICEKFLLCSPGALLLTITQTTWSDFDRASSLICGNKCQLDATNDFYCRSYCLLNMFQAPLCPLSGARDYYTDCCCLCYLVLWFSSCRYSVELRVMCPVWGLLQAATVCIIFSCSWWWA